ncbi:MAG: hypothetical protein AMXMBFR84_26460 [Candidatus Hydrogenedentota bacterium]
MAKAVKRDFRMLSLDLGLLLWTHGKSTAGLAGFMTDHGYQGKGIHQATLDKWARGEYRIPVSALPFIAAYLECSIDALFFVRTAPEVMPHVS